MSSTIDQQFVEFIVKSLVSDPDSVNIKRTIDEKGVLLELSVAQDDLGRVIGKRGATAQSIRTLLRALGTKNEARYNLKIIDPEGGPSERSSDDRKEEPKEEQPQDSDVDAEEEKKAETTLEDESTEVEETPADDGSDEDEESDEDDSMVARHRRDLEDLDRDDL